MTRFAGKVALVSGGARGLGANHARALVAQGAQVVIGDLLDQEGKALVEELGPAARFCHLDVTSEDGWVAAVEFTEQSFGSLSVLVNNAGIVLLERFMDTEPAAFRQQLDVNLVGMFLGIRAAAPALRRAGGGSVVNVSSIAGLAGLPGFAGYSASKWGVRGLTKTAAIELGGSGIRINSVHPGFIRTPMTAEAPLPPEAVGYQPIPRFGEMDEVTSVVLFLASEEASYVTGAEYTVDGGATAPIGGTGAMAALGIFPLD
ncbi:3-alpha-hydroxysteroid dehydrogenase [Amycolatopsis coloradensis]|uniref:3-alpha-hydroxysteroid dehydrogenase n=1 Tax=Amycolatopsis coloradensis TaxID=76021 RepID=A0A1R0KQT4_9PSEU|nr:glucose 1-dehydrogenase [Amycolatopsis coloradensis]OLZ50021.1 3-alpha-hydroxysteroid dehydrogenase [Amycolatopsis coloradensis]